MESSPEKSADLEKKPTITTAPFTSEQIDALNFYQESGVFHEFTCGNKHIGLDYSPSLIASENGWHCSIEGCDYTQNWTHSFMADKEMVSLQKYFLSGIDI